MKWKDQKEAFYKIAISSGLGRPEGIQEVFPLGHSLPPGKLETWLAKLHKPSGTFSLPPRYVNRFKIGADPEFVFASRTLGIEGLARIDAAGLGMAQGPAFGADNNGRLAEIRPHPHRSALEVCASTLVTLRWMSYMVPSTMSSQWMAGAWLFQDGVGGHVHFGRKRPNRAAEISALDTIEETFLLTGGFPRSDILARRRADAHGNHPYGLPGDFRLQRHGYEYRTWPSWLDSPELAFLILTLSKLAVHDPDLLRFSLSNAEVSLQRIRNLLGYYKNLDDDARLAFHIMQRHTPRHLGGDFRARWGITSALALQTSQKRLDIIPLTMPAGKPDVEEMFKHLYLGTPLEYKLNPPTWPIYQMPKGYASFIGTCQTVGVKGLGEMIWDLCGSNELPIRIVGARETGDAPIMVSSALSAMLKKAWRGSLGHVAHVFDSGRAEIHIAANYREGARARLTRKILTNGLFPIWPINVLRADSMAQWRANVGKQSNAKLQPEIKGTILYATDEVKI